ncbi:MAG: Rrf2 family transcriptional regulator [Magnetococcales bacterium]|nr:Rrf2 family transcriptional regulator [Magnetococcales bacterium]
MMPINRLTDYATLLMTHLAVEPQTPRRAVELTATIPLAFTTIRKLLQILARQGLLISRKGRHGGFLLARPPAEITLKQVVEAMEGPLALTTCCRSGAECALLEACLPKGHWMRLNGAINALLEETTLEDLLAPVSAKASPTY